MTVTVVDPTSPPTVTATVGRRGRHTILLTWSPAVDDPAVVLTLLRCLAATLDELTPLGLRILLGEDVAGERR